MDTSGFYNKKIDDLSFTKINLDEESSSCTSRESSLHYKEKCLSYVNSKDLLGQPPPSYEVEWDSDGQPAGERWPPLGAPNDEETESVYSYPEYGSRSCPSGAETDRLKELEDEQEQMNNSLLALTSHFAQVQFRLKQIVDASPEEKEKLLMDLDEFANRGIPDARQTFTNGVTEDDAKDSRLEMGHEKQRELIDQLKQQLEDLESFAYETGEAELPQSVVLRKQKVILDELKGKLNLNVENLDKLSFEELKMQVNEAAKELINPLRMKDQLVSQLQTQVVDLERFIEFLQGGGSEDMVEAASSSDCKCEGHTQPVRPKSAKSSRKYSHKNRSYQSRDHARHQLHSDTENLISKASTLLSMLTLVQFGCGSNKFERNTLKKTETGYHWGDLRATLEVAVATLVEASGMTPQGTDLSDSELEASSSEVTSCVRKQLCPALRDLIQHGLMKINQNTSLVPFLGCLPIRASSAPQLLHAWDLLLAYYKSKHGEQYNKTPARRLSQSFNLDLRGGSATTTKQCLLQTIGNILSTHAPLKRSADAHFKAFVSAALNEKKLVTWLRLIMRTPSIMQNYYQPWSYAAKTGFEDSFRSLEQLNKISFDLPVDLAVKNFQNIKDVF